MKKSVLIATALTSLIALNVNASEYKCEIDSSRDTLESFELNATKRAFTYEDKEVDAKIRCSLEEENPGDYSILHCEIAHRQVVIAGSASDLKESYVLVSSVPTANGSGRLSYQVACMKGL